MSELGGGRRFLSQLSEQLVRLPSRDDVALLLIEAEGFRDHRCGLVEPLGEIEHFGEIEQSVASQIQPIGLCQDRDRLPRQSQGSVDVALVGEHLGTGRAPQRLRRVVVF